MIPGRGIVIPLVDKYGARRSADEARIIKEMLEEDVDGFVSGNRIDAPAARDLRNEPLEVQLAVLDRGPLSVCVNPSAALIGRIRDAKRGIHEGRGPSLAPAPGAPPLAGAGQPLGEAGMGQPTGEVDKFLVENRLDQGAVMSFKAESPDVQRSVMDQGPLFNCTNPSAALMGRIRAVKMGVQSHYFGGAGPPGTHLGSGAPPPASLQDAPRPEAAPRPEVAPPEAPGQEDGSQPLGNIEDSRLNEEALKAIQQLNSEPREPDMPTAGEAAIGGGTRTGGSVSREEVDKFIRENRLDDRAAQSLRLEPPDVQTVVLERGSLADSINPSAALMGRIAQAKLSTANGSSGSLGAAAGTTARIERASPQDVDRFLAENHIDDRAAREFRVETAEVQATVINRGPLTNCTNPSSALLGRIRDAKRFAAMGPGGLGVGYGSVPSVARSSPY
mmetsp:Transcript_43173/g.134263  ORF Transcript_43173/g.134263 Transcript_43173/m.134263 type:complete len:446 (+) Transcript_43173:134-1471(+)